MSSGGWLGHTVSKVWHGVTGTVRRVMGVPMSAIMAAQERQAREDEARRAQSVSAAPAPTEVEQAEYDVAVANHKKKKRGKNSLYVSSSAGSSGGGSGINL